jgi:hypothetical protein
MVFVLPLENIDYNILVRGKKQWKLIIAEHYCPTQDKF